MDAQTHPECLAKDLDKDHDVDGTDYAHFQPCMSGPNNPPPIGCTAGGPPPAGTFTLHGRPVDVFTDPDGGRHALLYVRARHYDLTNGRWLQRDPLGYADGSNLYEAFAGNPLMYVDPSGLEPWIEFGAKREWASDRTGNLRITITDDGGYWGGARHLRTVELALERDKWDPTRRAWITIGARRVNVSIAELRFWCESLGEDLDRPSHGHTLPDWIIDTAIYDSFTRHFDGKYHGYQNLETGQYILDPNKAELVVQSQAELQHGLNRAMAEIRAGMEENLKAFLIVTGAATVGGAIKIIDAVRGGSAGSSGRVALQPDANQGTPPEVKINLGRTGPQPTARVADSAVSSQSPNVVDKSWKSIIHGTAQKTGTPGHQFRSYREAIGMAKSGQYESVHLNRSYSTVTGTETTPRRLPDVLGKRHTGQFDAVEVPSRTDSVIILRPRNINAMNQLPANQHGNVRIAPIR